MTLLSPRNMRILNISGRKDIVKLMRDMDVDPYGVNAMLPKARHCLLKIDSLNNVPANILKQEMLSLGADAALARGALTGQGKKTDCLLMGNISQFNRLRGKLNKQPFGLKRLALDVGSTLENYQKNNFQLKAGKYSLNLGKRSCVMGIVNVTADSFSGDGLLGLKTGRIIEYAMRLVRSGADIIDVGGESTRPGAKRVAPKDEAARVIPVIKALVRKLKVPVSIDTYKPEVAKRALDCGASIVNDVSGLRNIKMAKIAGRYKAGVVIMHMLKTPCSMQDNPRYDSLIDELFLYLKLAVDKAESSGVSGNSIIIDPGIGFGKTLSHNLEILKRLSEFKSLGRPILVGTSRKSFIGHILRTGPENRIFGTVASCVAARLSGAAIFRVHDVREVKEALTVTDNILT